ncbi:TRAF-type zinc finger domain containing protein 1 [Dissostichus eleginoides]|uniref:TRAF-type zinc finger domain containing protein 1 n=1 Tax=Dissostichus eleginoides TaxID=100907 RepID=A0AAD9FGL5_DISEL|nr:TRAF-type zinc finger domain containing protein 1 [Dissostichus eleginoides]
MDKQEATRTCGQCHKEVADVNFALHETHCSRFLVLCPDCEETSAECEQRLQVCLFCDLELPVKDMQDHSVVCGSRTELCRDCGRYVTLKLLNEHTSTCPGTQSGSEPAKNTRGLTPHKERGATASKTPHFLSKRPSRDSRADTFEEEDPDQISCCPHCHLALPLPTLRWHQAKCQIHVGLK